MLMCMWLEETKVFFEGKNKKIKKVKQHVITAHEIAKWIYNVWFLQFIKDI